MLKTHCKNYNFFRFYRSITNGYIKKIMTYLQVYQKDWPENKERYIQERVEGAQGN